MKPISDALGVGRSNVIERLATTESTGSPARGPEADEALLTRIRSIVDIRGSYGYRCVTRLLARQLDAEGLPRVNRKRVYRVMRASRLLLARHTGKPARTHDGVVITLKSNLRWCSDSFEIRCWNGERVQVAFSLDSCDREAMKWVATTAAITGEMIRDLMAESVEQRLGAGVMRVPHPLEWLGDNGPPHTANETRLRRIARLPRLQHASVLAGVERRGRVLREDVQARLRVPAQARDRSDGDGATRHLVRRLHRGPPAQRPEDAVAARVPQELSSPSLGVSGLTGATPTLQFRVHALADVIAADDPCRQRRFEWGRPHEPCVHGGRVRDIPSILDGGSTDDRLV